MAKSKRSKDSHTRLGRVAAAVRNAVIGEPQLPPRPEAVASDPNWRFPSENPAARPAVPRPSPWGKEDRAAAIAAERRKHALDLRRRNQTAIERFCARLDHRGDVELLGLVAAEAKRLAGLIAEKPARLAALRERSAQLAQEANAARLDHSLVIASDPEWSRLNAAHNEATDAERMLGVLHTCFCTLFNVAEDWNLRAGTMYPSIPMQERVAWLLQNTPEGRAVAAEYDRDHETDDIRAHFRRQLSGPPIRV